MASIQVENKASRAKLDLQATPVEEKTSVEVVTPSKAAKWLEANTHNRNLNSHKVTLYARDMERGKWRFGNDAICFALDGALLNGQHRLHACVMSGTSFRCIIIRNMPNEAQDVMDQGGVRTMAGILHLRGHINTVRLGGALRALIAIDHAGDGFNVYRPTTQELLTLLQKHPKLTESVDLVETCRGVSPSSLAAVHYVAKVLLKEDKKADAFVNVFSKGIPSYQQDPAHLLRENTIKHQDRKTKKASKDSFYALLRAWNAFRDDERWGKWTPPRNVVAIKGLKSGMI